MERRDEGGGRGRQGGKKSFIRQSACNSFQL